MCAFDGVTVSIELLVVFAGTVSWGQRDVTIICVIKDSLQEEKCFSHSFETTAFVQNYIIAL